MIRIRSCCFLLFCLWLLLPLTVTAQIGEHRNDFAVGANVGMGLSTVGFSPKVTQAQHIGNNAGLSFRYTSEKYFSIIASIYGEVNIAQMGWKEDIIDLNTNPVIGVNGEVEMYQRNMTYVTMPLMAHLAWGRERKGMQFFFRAGPQFGYLLGESTETNFLPDEANYADRANKCREQYNLSVKNRFDYGIAAGVGVEYVNPKLGHFLLDGRYYFGLGNIFGATKQDYFGKSDNMAIEVRLAYMIDLVKTK